MKKFSFDHVVLSPKDQIGLHKQSSWELSYIIRGEGLRTIGDRTERFQSGEIALVVPEMPHQWKFDMPSDGEDAQIENITITFPPILLTQLSNTFDEMAALSPLVQRVGGVDNPARRSQPRDAEDHALHDRAGRL